MTAATGTLGGALSRALAGGGWRVAAVSRQALAAPPPLMRVMKGLSTFALGLLHRANRARLDRFGRPPAS